MLPVFWEWHAEEQQHVLYVEVAANMPGTPADSVFLGEWVELTSALSNSPSAETLELHSIHVNLFSSAGVSRESEEEKENVFC